MDVKIIVFMLLASFMHALWHTLVKNSGDILISLVAINIVSGSIGVVAIFLVTPPNINVIVILLLSVVVHVLYKLSLAKMYSKGEISCLFPFARGIAPLVAAMIAWALLEEKISNSHLYGIILISFGLISLVFERGIPKLDILSALGVAVGVGTLVGLYSVIDGLGSRLAPDWLSFAAWLYVIDAVAFIIVVRLIRGPKIWNMLTNNYRIGILSGLIATVSYGVFLWALSVGEIGVVTALRETSILFVVLLGSLFLREKINVVRISAIFLLIPGLVLIAH